MGPSTSINFTIRPNVEILDKKCHRLSGVSAIRQMSRYRVIYCLFIVHCSCPERISAFFAGDCAGADFDVCAKYNTNRIQLNGIFMFFISLHSAFVLK